MIDKYLNVFWDFDGVIKETVEIKSHSFKNLFENISDYLRKKIHNHHLENSGISRFEKIPIYMEWSNIKINQENLDYYISKFENSVKDAVVSSNWVEGAEELIKKNKFNQNFYLITGTPQKEIEEILRKIEIKDKFINIIGSPTTKSNAIKNIIKKYNLERSDCIMIGDSIEDLKASEHNKIFFILREHKMNQIFFKKYDGHRLRNFTNL